MVLVALVRHLLIVILTANGQGRYPTPMQSFVVSTDGTRIAYQVAGTGPVLVLVHGILSSRSAWEAVLPYLTSHYTVYTLDRRGREDSTDGPLYSVEREFDDIVALVEAVGEGVTLMGHSFGGLCVFEAALRTAFVQRLIAYEPAPAPVSRDLVEGLYALLEANEREAVVLTFLAEFMSTAELRHYAASPRFAERVTVAHTIPREVEAVARYRLEAGRFAHLNLPTLLIRGAETPPYLRGAIDNWQAVLPTSRIVELEGQKSMAMYQAPERLAHAILAFMGEEG